MVTFCKSALTNALALIWNDYLSHPTVPVLCCWQAVLTLLWNSFSVCKAALWLKHCNRSEHLNSWPLGGVNVSIKLRGNDPVENYGSFTYQCIICKAHTLGSWPMMRSFLTGGSTLMVVFLQKKQSVELITTWSFVRHRNPEWEKIVISVVQTFTWLCG